MNIISYDTIYKDLATIIQAAQIDTINQVIQIKYFYEDKIKEICPIDEKIKSSLSSAFESAIFLKVNTLSEQFSQYLDSLLVKKDENKNEEQALGQIKKALDLLKYFSAKDIFEHFYTQRLTRRLLLDLSVSVNLEVEILQILKQQCGDQYVRKAEEVLKEVRKSYDYEHQGIRVNLVIISQNSWTLRNDQIPDFFLKNQKSIFQAQHQQEFKQKLLFWLVDCSHCQVKAFNKVLYLLIQYTLLVSAVQAMILDFYNFKKEYKPSELIETSGLSKDEILRNLIPLEKEKILLKTGANTFQLNFEFSSKRNIIKINQMQKNEKKEEIEQSTEKLLHDRKYVIDASIVKIMKRDKQHTLLEIINLVLKDLGLPINRQDIKQQIEVLTEKEYLQRDQNDMNLFIYLA
ncbi:hypothetical protein FGO68_gene4019 [Halteria grandinella]|uniref:Cullin family profile domain-containing protein n=1 Tax=Halteria grandinella TaxID=5974 RepID=A0A8J8SX87_HALGN|nr:hypothetical protein FGO68_gene4019 [Halteria grandinella]